MSGYEEAKAVNDKLKAEIAEKKEKEEENVKVAINQLAALRDNSQLAKMYADNAQVGARNLSGEYPMLKVHVVGKSSSNVLSDGTEPQDGYFFYAPTQEQMKEIDCHILTISRGFRTEGMEIDPETKKPKIVFNQIMGGLWLDRSDYRPFIIYLTGKKLNPMWEFGKQANRYIHAKPVSIPMFAMTIHLTTEKVDSSNPKFGKSWIINFTIKKEEGGFPTLIMDEGKFQFVKDSVQTLEEMIDSIIEAKEVKTDIVKETVFKEEFIPSE